MKSIISKLSCKFLTSKFSPFVRLSSMLIIILGLFVYASNLVINKLFGAENTNILQFIFVIGVIAELLLCFFIPFGSKSNTNIYIMLIPDKLSNDYSIIKTMIFKKIKQEFPDYKLYCPNVFSRFLFNSALENENKLLSKIYIWIFRQISKSSLCIYGNIVGGYKDLKNTISLLNVSILSFTENDKHFDTICKNLDSNPLPIVEDEFKYIQNASDIILLYLKMAFSVTELSKENCVKVLKDYIELFENSKKANYDEPYGNEFGKHISQAIEATISWLIINMSYKPYPTLEMTEFLALCKRFLDTSPNNIDAIVTYQYGKVSSLLCDKNLCPSILNAEVNELLKYCNTANLDKNNYSLTANRAFLELIKGNLSKAIELYNTLKSSPETQKCQTNTAVYEFLRIYSEETKNYLISYVKFAFCIVRLNMQPRDAIIDNKIKEDLLSLINDNNSIIKSEAKKLFDRFFKSDSH